MNKNRVVRNKTTDGQGSALRGFPPLFA